MRSAQRLLQAAVHFIAALLESPGPLAGHRAISIEGIYTSLHGSDHLCKRLRGPSTDQMEKMSCRGKIGVVIAQQNCYRFCLLHLVCVSLWVSRFLCAIL